MKNEKVKKIGIAALMLVVVEAALFSQITVDDVLDTYKKWGLYTGEDVPTEKIPNFDDIEFNKQIFDIERPKPPIMVSAMQNDEPIAFYSVILYSEEKGYYKMYDMDGDEIFDYQTTEDMNYSPNWVLFKADMKRSKDMKEFLGVCSELYAGFNNIKGPDKKKYAELIKKITNKVKDKKAEDRDLYYSLLTYLLSNNNYRLGIIGSTYTNTKERNNNKPVELCLLYLGEAYISQGLYKFALNNFKDLKTIDNDSIIADFYIAEMEDVINKTNKNRQAFKSKNPDFWALKK
ncbi:MAG: hypothetical protein LBC53_01520 [Spirochaetaceae bacterium]|jgi:hypothetical protein|nr:hypothetical protein [Spirochaetaceae bacterium]